MQRALRIRIGRMRNKAEAETCARALETSEPWITLRRGYKHSIKPLMDPSRETYVATHGKDIVGFVLLDIRGPFRGYIHLLCVMAEWRGRGIGDLLINHIEKRVFREQPNVFLCVSSFNRGAQRFYKRMGFKRVGTIHDYIIKGHSEYLMRKTRGPINGYKASRR